MTEKFDQNWSENKRMPVFQKCDSWHYYVVLWHVVGPGLTQLTHMVTPLDMLSIMMTSIKLTQVMSQWTHDQYLIECDFKLNLKIFGLWLSRLQNLHHLLETKPNVYSIIAPNSGCKQFICRHRTHTSDWLTNNQ